MGSAREVFLAFLQQGCVSFGGPVAHLGYFRKEFVERRGWLSEADYAGLVALCQFLPGPASSQVGMALGHLRAGWWGALAAWVGFTFPSALLMYLAAVGLPLVGGGDGPGGGWLIGVKLVAVAVVTQAVWQMSRSLAPGGLRAVMALAAAAFSLLIPGFAGQIGAILLGALSGWLWLREGGPETQDQGEAQSFALPKAALACLLVFAALLLAAFAFSGEGAFGLFSSFFRSGALVFGGGHVVLPFLEAETVGREVMTRDSFIAGYGLAQALPGPLFAFSSFLGTAQESSPSGLAGGLIALVAIFLPGALLLFGALPIWDWLKGRAQVRAAMAGVNAAVVGLLLAVLYDPLWTSAVTTPLQFAVFLGLAALLFVVRWPAWAIVLVGAAVGAVIL